MQLVFAPNNEALEQTMHMTVQAALQQWLGDLIQVQKIDVRAEDSNLFVTVHFMLLRTLEPQVENFQRNI